MSKLWSIGPAGVGRRGHRRGAVMLVVLVCLGIAAVVLVTILKMAAAEQQMLRKRQWHVQAAWLAESGLERAAARLAADPEYRGESWAIGPELLGSRHAGTVSISIETIAGQPKRRAVRVVADYPNQLPNQMRCSRETVLDL